MGCGTYKPEENKDRERKSNRYEKSDPRKLCLKENESLHLQDWFSRCLLSALLIQSRIAGTSEKKFNIVSFELLCTALIVE